MGVFVVRLPPLDLGLFVVFLFDDLVYDLLRNFAISKLVLYGPKNSLQTHDRLVHVDPVTIVVLKHVAGKRSWKLHRQEVCLQRDQVNWKLVQFDVLVVQQSVEPEHVIAFDCATRHETNIVFCVFSVLLLPEHLLNQGKAALKVRPQTVDKLL